MSKQSKKNEEPKMMQAFNRLVDLVNDQNVPLDEALNRVKDLYDLTGLEKHELKVVYRFILSCEQQSNEEKTK